MNESLDQLLPAYYRVRDDERSGALAAVMEVIEREVGGRVVCDESPDGGARFSVTLPLVPLERP